MKPSATFIALPLLNEVLLALVALRNIDLPLVHFEPTRAVLSGLPYWRPTLYLNFGQLDISWQPNAVCRLCEVNSTLFTATGCYRGSLHG